MNFLKEALELLSMFEGIIKRGLQWPFIYLVTLIAIYNIEGYDLQLLVQTKPVMLVGLLLAFLVSSFFQLLYDEVIKKRANKDKEEVDKRRKNIESKWNEFKHESSKEANEIMNTVQSLYPKYRHEDPEKWERLNTLTSKHEGDLRNFHV